MEEFQLDRAHEVRPEVLKRQLLLTMLCLVVALGTISAWRGWSDRGPAGDHSLEQRRAEAEGDLARALAAFTADPCALPQRAEVTSLVGETEAEATTEATLAKRCRWTTTRGTIQVLVSPHGDVFEPRATDPTATTVDLGDGLTGRLVSGLTLGGDTGSSLEFTVGERFGSVGLDRRGELSPGDLLALEILARRLADELR